jgi:hypothetical protein
MTLDHFLAKQFESREFIIQSGQEPDPHDGSVQPVITVPF